MAHRASKRNVTLLHPNLGDEFPERGKYAPKELLCFLLTAKLRQWGVWETSLSPDGSGELEADW